MGGCVLALPDSAIYGKEKYDGFRSFVSNLHNY